MSTRGPRLGTILKLVGLAGLAGVAATGVAVARDDRTRRAYTPEDVRERLHARYTQAVAAADASESLSLAPITPPTRRPWERAARVLRHRSRHRRRH